MHLKSERFEMRLDTQTLQQVEAWRAEQPDRPSRAEAVRRLVAAGLAVSAKDEVRFSAEEKLILTMLCDLHKHLNVRGEMDPEFVMKAITGGHYWAFEWEYQGLLDGQANDPRIVSEVVGTLDMWDFIESGYGQLSQREKQRVDAEVHPLAGPDLFHGFDGNEENEYFRVAEFLVEGLDRFRRFKGRDLNSHSNSLDDHRKMRSAFEPMRPRLVGVSLSADQIIELFKARIPSERSGDS